MFAIIILAGNNNVNKTQMKTIHNIRCKEPLLHAYTVAMHTSTHRKATLDYDDDDE